MDHHKYLLSVISEIQYEYRCDHGEKKKPWIKWTAKKWNVLWFRRASLCLDTLLLLWTGKVQCTGNNAGDITEKFKWTCKCESQKSQVILLVNYSIHKFSMSNLSCPHNTAQNQPCYFYQKKNKNSKRSEWQKRNQKVFAKNMVSHLNSNENTNLLCWPVCGYKIDS